MPTVLRVGPYRFFFFAGDRSEPPHVHIERDENEAKFWLNSIQLEENLGFSRKEINQIEKIVAEHQAELLGRWHEFFS